MSGLYARWMVRWENHLATRDSNRLVRPFEWGLDWLDIDPGCPDPLAAVEGYGAQARGDSDAFFSYEPVSDYELRGSHLTFSSPLRGRHPENATVHAEFFPAPKGNGRAVLVLPQWNADAGGHIGLCKLLNRFGLSALRMSLAYHDRRMPAELQRADYHVSSNIGRTIHACRQSIVDGRTCLDWLESRGFKRLGILGTSLGSCIAFIIAAHDSRVAAGAFNHVSMYFSDVVWTGLSTRHVRQAFSGDWNQERLRRCWTVISPAAYIDRLNGRDMATLLVWAKHDTTFLPEYSLQIVNGFRERKLPHSVFTLPCGHYTTGQFPFNLIDGLTLCRFLAARL